jgi:ABC-type branched-subunit amino acid transport system substrate-binding protein
MRSTSRATRTAAVLAASALVLAACGSDSDDPEPSGGEDTASESTEAPEESEAPAAATGDGTLTVGMLLPQTGDLAFLGPPEFAGVDLAIKDINEAGGVLGKDVTGVRGDSGDGTPDIASGEVDKLLDGGADVIVGAAASGVSITVIDKITDAGAVHFSPANTSPDFDKPEVDPNELYFRTAPSDVLQGAVMANLLTEDGHSNVAILARQDSYGQALADVVDENFTNTGGTVTAKELYDANASNFSAEVQAVAASEPDAIVLIAFNETTQIIPELVRNGVGPKDVQIYFVDGNTADYSADFPEGTLEGVRATYPGAELTGDFRERMLSINPKLKDFTYGPESYDTVVVSALAAIAAQDDGGEAVGAAINDVTRGGEKCTTFKDCAALLEEDPSTDIDYDGVSGPLEFSDTGSPTAATIGIFEYAADNTYSNVEYVTGQI